MSPSAMSDVQSGSPATPLPEALEKLRYHFVGIGGCGMAGLASLLLRRGARVSGTDRRESAASRKLAELGVRFTTVQAGESIPAETDVVVVSAAIPADHPERVAAHERGLRVLKYAEFLGLVMAHHEGLAISGTHGKSTTTAWLTYVLRTAGLDPSFVVGANVPQLGGGSGAGDGPHFVAEACEYDRSFLNLTPRRAAILNIEEDHLDCYKDIVEIRAAFTAFARRVPADGLVLLNADDAGCRGLAEGLAATVETFGLRDGTTWRAVDLQIVDGCHAFEARHNGTPLGRVRLGLPGRHNVSNALAVIALARHCGVAWDALARSLADFAGAGRRLELRGEVRGVRVLDDYAHHPTEIRATLQAAQERYQPRKLWCVFQPHQHSRTRFLLADFARSFAQADEVVVPDIYFVRDSERERDLVCAADLVERIVQYGGRARYVPDFFAIVDLVARGVQPGDVVITMGAGNVWEIADDLVRRLRGNL